MWINVFGAIWKSYGKMVFSPNCSELCRLYSPLVPSIFATLTHQSGKTQPTSQTWSLGQCFSGEGRKSLAPLLELEMNERDPWLPAPFLGWESPVNVMKLHYWAGCSDKCLNISNAKSIWSLYSHNGTR